MSDTQNKLVRTFKDEDGSTLKYRLVKLGAADNEVVIADDADELIIGISNEAAGLGVGQPVSVVMWGIAKCIIASSATAKGDNITSDADGKGIATVTAGDYVVGWLLETTSADDQIAKVLVNPIRRGLIV